MYITIKIPYLYFNDLKLLYSYMYYNPYFRTKKIMTKYTKKKIYESIFR